MSISDVVNSLKEVYQRGNDFLLEKCIKADNYFYSLVPVAIAQSYIDNADNISQVNSNNDLGFRIITGSAGLIAAGSVIMGKQIENKNYVITGALISVIGVCGIGIGVGYSMAKGK